MSLFYFNILQTITNAKVKSALRSEGNQEKLQEAINLEVTQEKWQMQNEFDKKVNLFTQNK